MDKAIARLNIEYYRRLLANEIDETRRQALRRLLAEEEAKLAVAESDQLSPTSGLISHTLGENP